MPNPVKPGRATLAGPLNDLSEAAFDPAEVSGNAMRRMSGDPPALPVRLGQSFASAARGAHRRSSAERRPSANSGDAAEAPSDRNGSTSDRAGAPSSAPRVSPAVASAAPETPVHVASFGPAAEASGPRHASRPEAGRDRVTTLSASARAAWVGATGASTPAGGAPSDPEANLQDGVPAGAYGRKPDGATPEAPARDAHLPAPRASANRLSGSLAALAETARDYARSAQADNTRRAYAADWRMFAAWLRRQGLPETPPDPEAVGLYLASQAERRGAELSIATLERRLSGIAWRYRQLGEPLEIRDRHIATVLAGIRRRHGRPPAQKAAIFADELLAMLATLNMDLRGLRDRAMLAIGFAGGLRRSEIVGLDCGPRQTEDGSGWVELFPEGALLTIRGKTGWRDVEIGRGSGPSTCPVALLETWLRLGRISHGPVFRPIARKNDGVSGERLSDKHVVRLVKKCALAAGLRGDLAEGDRRLAFGGHSLRAGLASSAQIEEAHVQRHLGHTSAEMTRRYQRKRDRFSINLTKAAGL
jgi:integrase